MILPQRLEQSRETWRARRLEAERLAGDRMGEAEDRRMEGLAGHFAYRGPDIFGQSEPFGLMLAGLAIGGVSQKRVPDAREMYPDLMRASRFQAHF